MNAYKIITIEDLVKFVNEHPDLFKKGMKTPVVSGDFECNYTHKFHEIQHIDPDEVFKEPCICLGYEMHENAYS